MTETVSESLSVASDVGDSDWVSEREAVNESEAMLDGLGSVMVTLMVGVTVCEFRSVSLKEASTVKLRVHEADNEGVSDVDSGSVCESVLVGDSESVAVAVGSRDGDDDGVAESVGVVDGVGRERDSVHLMDAERVDETGEVRDSVDVRADVILPVFEHVISFSSAGKAHTTMMAPSLAIPSFHLPDGSSICRT